jgi:hypothetical protein
MKIIAPKRLMESVFPTVRNGGIFNASSLDLQFARTKTLNPRITFTRASSGTYVGADGLIKTAATNEARFDHNPTTGESLGLLVEESRTNLLLRSEEFDNASWAKTQATISANATSAPDGSNNADKLVINSGQTAGWTAQSLSFVNGNVYSVSCYAKAGEFDEFRFVFGSAAFTSNLVAVFNLNTGVVSSFTASSASIQALSNGWYRCTATATATTTASASLQFRCNATGDGTSGIYLWGAQLEAGAFPTSYIPTITATVTRSADVASISGTNFSSWYRQDEGTVFTEGSSAWASGNFVGSSDNTNNNRIFIGVASGPASRLLITTSGSTAAAVTVPYTLNTSLRGAGGYKENSSQFAANGVLGTEDTNCTIPTVNRLSIGSNTTSSDFFLNGTIRRLAYFPQRLSNSTLQEITR